MQFKQIFYYEFPNDSALKYERGLLNAKKFGPLSILNVQAASRICKHLIQLHGPDKRHWYVSLSHTQF